MFDEEEAWKEPNSKQNREYLISDIPNYTYLVICNSEEYNALTTAIQTSKEYETFTVFSALMDRDTRNVSADEIIQDSKNYHKARVALIKKVKYYIDLIVTKK